MLKVHICSQGLFWGLFNGPRFTDTFLDTTLSVCPAFHRLT